ncbi:Non-specific serine/threonine protein kinase protein [Dioscorea alata]|uniref:Non-specific serine/threonine protein kinase protein n=1 Tax=Dioscorea alata TaxID=55571 RepID=A0ACB7WQT7_DIOAL|nr:Non-specific serine/threonine protein kinase protein [Dioscorea alata]
MLKMGVMKKHFQLALMFCLLCLELAGFCNCGDGSICREVERKALVDFKNGLEDPNGRLSSWIGLDCCSWTGVHCHNYTGHVIRLDLRRYGGVNESLGGEIRPSLLVLNHLRYLDLSQNSFEFTRIPTFLGSLVSLRYLNLAYATFSGHVPHQLGNLSRLRYLDLSENSLDMVGSHWLTNLSSLQCLNLNGVNLSKAKNVLKSLNTLPLISEISLSFCALHIPLSLGVEINLTNLRFLDLSSNDINSTMPFWLFKLSSFEYLYLQDNNFQDLIPSDIGQLTSLRVLDLANNGVPSARLPITLGKLCNLSKLYLSGNKYFSGDLNRLGETFSGCLINSLEELYWSDSALSGPLPSWLGNLKSLKALDLSYNSFYGSLLQLRLPYLQALDLSNNNCNGTIPKYLGQLCPELDTLDLSYNNIAVRPDWVPPPKLEYLNMVNCKVGPRFPSWLQDLKNLSSLTMSNASIVDALPLWFWNFSLAIEDIDLSHNEIKGKLPEVSSKLPDLQNLDLSHNYLEGQLPRFSSKLPNLQFLDLSHNYLEGQLPRLSPKLTNLEVLDLSHNYLEGQLPQFSSDVVHLDQAHGLFSRSTFSNTSIIVPSLTQLFISSNKITGSIPKTLCKLNFLSALDLSHNMIEGVVPDCWNLSLIYRLIVMDLSHNNLFGIIPTSINSLYLDTLHLSNNAFSGELPASFKNCTSLSVLDLGYNNISGSIPTWLAENLKLHTLELRNNMLTGSIPPQLANLSLLHVIDVSNNHLSGAIPHSFGNFSAMKTQAQFGEGLIHYVNNIEINLKGRDVQLEKVSAILICIDLSNNMLSGEIPEELGHLSYLQSLNLSRNHLLGQLSEKIGQLRWLEVLDLSVNNLSGVLPASLTNLTSLNHLNLSYNKFYGKIPYGGQLQALPDPSIYSGNQGLCGFPLDKKCEITAPAQPPSLPNNEDDDNSENIWFYLSMSLGFIFGFWAIFGALILKKRWRYAYFRFVDHIYDKIYVIVAVNVKKMKRKCGLASE